MPANPPNTSGADPRAAALRSLAAGAHRALRRGRPVDRAELLALLDEIAHARRLLDDVASDELADWFDRLEAQVAGKLDRIDRTGVASACGAGAA